MPTSSKPVYLAGPPALFRPDQTWAKGPYRYFLDSRRRVCKQVPIDLQLQLTSEARYFKMKPGVVEQVAADVAATQREIHAGRLRGAYQQLRRRTGRYKVLARLFVAGSFVAVVMIAYPWVPEAQYRLQQALNPPTALPAVETANSFTQPAPTTQSRVVIPKIGVDSAILEAPDLSILDRAEGVWHQTGSLSKGNYVLAGHRFKYLPPNSTTLYNLDKLEVGDIALVDHEGTRRTYRVQSKRVVPASAVSVLDQTPGQQLTIYTCNDVRETERIVIVATPAQTP